MDPTHAQFIEAIKLARHTTETIVHFSEQGFAIVEEFASHMQDTYVRRLLPRFFFFCRLTPHFLFDEVVSVTVCLFHTNRKILFKLMQLCELL